MSALLKFVEIESVMPTEIIIVVRHLRQILAAVSGHGYEATYYLEYSDGTIEVQETKVIAINATNIRKNSKSRWEERVTGAPGWFGCDSPFKE